MEMLPTRTCAALKRELVLEAAPVIYAASAMSRPLAAADGAKRGLKLPCAAVRQVQDNSDSGRRTARRSSGRCRLLSGSYPEPHRNLRFRHCWKSVLSSSAKPGPKASALLGLSWCA